MAAILRKTLYSLLLFTVVYFQQVLSESRYAVLVAKTSPKEENFCTVYCTKFSILPEEKSKADYHQLQDYTDIDFCFEDVFNLENQIVILSHSKNCSSAKQVRFLQDNGAAAALFMISGGNMCSAFNTTLSDTINITVGFIHTESVKYLHKWRSNITACMFSPVGFRFDLSLVIIWLISLFIIFIGSYWSGRVRYDLYSKEVTSPLNRQNENEQNENYVISPVENKKPVEESTMNISVIAVGIFVICMTLTLLLMYYFYDYMVYFLISLFVIASMRSIYVGLYPIVMKFFPPCIKTIECYCFDKLCKFEYRNFFLLTISLAFPIFWACTRKERYSWILQDILGTFFCINLLKSARLPNLKVCSALLILLFFYDIFFVFITPLFTMKGESVMEKVARGGKSNETFPMTINVPHITFDPLTVCTQDSSPTILGLGDIIIPGMLVAYCYGFDLITNISNKCRVYFYSTLFAYGIGLLITYVALYLMRTAQPALLYLVPSTLLTVLVIGFKRGELSLLWKGFAHISDINSSKICNQVSSSSHTQRREILSSENEDIDNVSTKDVDDTDISISQQTPVVVSCETKHLL